MRRVLAPALLALALVAAPAPAQDDDGGGFLERLIEDNLSGAGRDVRITGFEGALSSEAHLDELTIADAQGIWITLRDVTLDWNRSALLRGRLEVTELTAGEIIVPRRPGADPALLTPEARPFALPDLPVSVRIDKVAAQRVELGEALFGAAAVVTLDGSANLDDGAGRAQIALQRIDGRVGELTLDAAYDNADQTLALKLNVTEAEDGIAVNLLDLPGRPSLRLNVEGEGPLADFIAEIALDTDGQRRLDGTVELTASGSGDAVQRGFSAEIGGDLAPVFAPQYRPFFGQDIRLIARGADRPEGGFALSQLALTAQALQLEGRVSVGADGLPDLIDVTGEIAAPDGGPVLLPLGGEDTRVDRLGLAVQFDAAVSEDWTAQITLDDLTRPDIAIGNVTLEGTGRIAAAGEGTQTVTAVLDLTAEGLAARDPAVQQALGERARGRADIAWTSGGPVVLRDLALNGNSFGLDGSGQVGFGDTGTTATLSAQLDSDDLTAFSGLAGRDLGGAAAVKLDLQTAPLDGSFDIALSGTATDLRVSQPQADALLTGRTALTLRARRDETGTRIETLTLDNPDFALEASGELTSLASSLRANLRLPEAAVLDDKLSGPVDLTALARMADGVWDYDLRGTGAGAEIDATGSVTGLDDPTPRITTEATIGVADLARFSGLAGRDLGGAVDLRLAGHSLGDLSVLDLSIDAATRDVRTGEARFDDALIGRTELSARVQRDGATITLPEFRLVGVDSGLRASGSGEVRDFGSDAARAEGTLDAGAADLSRLAGLAGRPLSGSVALKATGAARLDLSEVDADLDLTGRAITTGFAQVDPLLAGDVAVQGQVTRRGDRVEVDGLRLSAGAAGLTLTGSGVAEDVTEGNPRVTLDARLSAADLAPLSGLAGRPLGGTVEVSAKGSARLDLSEIDAAVDLTGRDIATGFAQVDPLLTGDVALQGQVTRQGDAVTVEGLRLTAGAAGLTLTGRATAEGITGVNPLVTLDTELAASDLSPLSALAGRPLGGAVDLSVKGEASADLGVLDLTVAGQARSLTLGQENADRLLRGVTVLDLRVQREGDAIALPRLSLKNDQITVQGDGRYRAGESAVQADVTIADLSDLDARMRGQARFDLFAEEVGEVWQVRLDGTAAEARLEAAGEVRGALSGNPTLSGRASLRADDLTRFAPLANRPLAGALSAEVQGSLRADLGVFDVTADVDGTNLRIGQEQADRILGATTDLRLVARRAGPDRPIEVQTFRIATPSLTASAEGTVLGSDASLVLDARLSDIGPYVNGALTGPVAVDGRVTSRAGQLDLALSGTGPGGISVRVDGTVAQDFSRADLALSGQAPLSLANPVLAPRLLDGTLGFDVAVRGPLALSSVTGQLTSRGARFVDPALGLVLENIALDATLTGGAVQVNLQADKEGGGRLTVTGPIALTGGFDADLRVQAVGLVVEDPRLYRALLNGAVTVVGPLAGGARIAGLLDLVETEIRIPSTGLGATGPIPDGLVHVNEPAAVRATRARAGLLDTGGGGGRAGTARPYPLDLTIRATNRLFIRGRGLDAEMGGELALRGTTADIIPSGQFDLIRGRLDILGKRLDLVEGSVSLQGDFSPFIRLVASTDAGDVTVLIVVEGPALQPEIDFLSQPELPEEEVLARLLFGRSLTSISPLQAAQLASAVATLAGKGGDGVIANLRKGTGLDDLDITTDSEGNAGLRAGKYLSENLYTDVTVGSDGSAEINLNLDLTPNLTVKGSASNSGETSLGIFFEKDY